MRRVEDPSKQVEPGYSPTARFSQNSEIDVQHLVSEAHAGFAQPIFAEFANPAMMTKESNAAEVVWLAANDASPRLRYPAGPDTVALAQVA